MGLGRNRISIWTSSIERRRDACQASRGRHLQRRHRFEGSNSCVVRRLPDDEWRRSDCVAISTSGRRCQHRSSARNGIRSERFDRKTGDEKDRQKFGQECRQERSQQKAKIDERRKESGNGAEERSQKRKTERRGNWIAGKKRRTCENGSEICWLDNRKSLQVNFIFAFLYCRFQVKEKNLKHVD